jgi:hypothetical protein
MLSGLAGHRVPTPFRVAAVSGRGRIVWKMFVIRVVSVLIHDTLAFMRQRRGGGAERHDDRERDLHASEHSRLSDILDQRCRSFRFASLLGFAMSELLRGRSGKAAIYSHCQKIFRTAPVC